MAIAAVIAISATQNSGAAPSLPTDTARIEKAAPEKCPSVLKALRFYTKRLEHWTTLRHGAPTAEVRGTVGKCPRFLLKLRKAKAFAAHREWNRWFSYQYAWSEWLPSNWRALAICETGLNWEHSNSSFTSAFGISWSVYNSDARYMGAPPWHVRHTPRDQYMAALGHLRRFGDGWGCPGP